MEGRKEEGVRGVQLVRRALRGCVANRCVVEARRVAPAEALLPFPKCERPFARGARVGPQHQRGASTDHLAPLCVVVCLQPLCDMFARSGAYPGRPTNVRTRQGRCAHVCGGCNLR
eukprot:1051248-Pyramimonas_sp.AAC.2